MGALLCGLVPGRTPLRGSAEHRPGSRGPHLRALRGSSVSTALSSGWNRKSSTYSPNFSKNHFCMRGHSPWPRRSAETAGVGEGEGRARGGREAFRRRGEEAPRWRPDCGGTGSPKTEPDPLGPQGATPAHADHTGGLGVPHTDPRWPEAVPSTCAVQAAPHPLTGGTGPSRKELSGLTPRTLGDSQRGSASGTVPWWV